MSDEKPKEHEHHEEEHHESAAPKTITIKKDTVWKAATFVFLVLFVISLFTGGFGIGNSTGYASNTNTGTTGTSSSAFDMSTFTSNPNLFPSLGPANANNVVIEFADFQCPYCAMATGLPNWTKQYSTQVGYYGVATQLEQLAQQNKIRFIFVPWAFLDNPSDSNGPESTQAAQAGFCALQQSNSLFWKMHDAIYAASTGPTEDDGKYSIPNLEKIAASISGIDTAKFNSCLENNSTLSQVTAVQQAVAAAGVSGTPTFVVNGQMITNPSTTAIMSAIGQ